MQTLQPDPSTVLPTGADPTNAMTGNKDFLTTLQSTLMDQSGMISSANTGLETAISSAINNVQKSTLATGGQIESKYNREIGYQTDSNNNAITAARERGVGVNTSDVAYKAMASEADKSIKDLEMRKNELLLQNDALGASKVSDLILQTQKMKIDGMQKTFENLLSTANFGINFQASKRADQAQTFQEKSAISTIGLQYGVPVVEGDTLATIVSKAAPFASKKQQAELGLLLANTQKAQAEANKAYNDGKLPTLTDPLLLSSAARLYRTNYADFVSKAKNTNEVSTVQQAAIREEGQDVKTIAESAVANGMTNYNDVFNYVNTQLANQKMPMIAPGEAGTIIESVVSKVPKAPVKQTVSTQEFMSNMNKDIVKGGKSVGSGIKSIFGGNQFLQQ